MFADIPQEILDLFVIDLDDLDLTVCSLVCRSFRFASRKRRFQHLDMTFHVDDSQNVSKENFRLASFYEIAEEDPTILQAVLSLRLNVDLLDRTVSRMKTVLILSHLASLFTQAGRLHELYIGSGWNIVISDIPFLTDALMTFRLIPSLRILHLERLRQPPLELIVADVDGDVLEELHVDNIFYRSITRGTPTSSNNPRPDIVPATDVLNTLVSSTSLINLRGLRIDNSPDLSILLLDSEDPQSMSSLSFRLRFLSLSSNRDLTRNLALTHLASPTLTSMRFHDGSLELHHINFPSFHALQTLTWDRLNWDLVPLLKWLESSIVPPKLRELNLGFGIPSKLPLVVGVRLHHHKFLDDSRFFELFSDPKWQSVDKCLSGPLFPLLHSVNVGFKAASAESNLLVARLSDEQLTTFDTVTCPQFLPRLRAKDWITVNVDIRPMRHNST